MLSQEFLINQGECCGHRCRLCPYEPKYNQGSKKLNLIMKKNNDTYNEKLMDYNNSLKPRAERYLKIFYTSLNDKMEIDPKDGYKLLKDYNQDKIIFNINECLDWIESKYSIFSKSSSIYVNIKISSIALLPFLMYKGMISHPSISSDLKTISKKRLKLLRYLKADTDFQKDLKNLFNWDRKGKVSKEYYDELIEEYTQKSNFELEEEWYLNNTPFLFLNHNLNIFKRQNKKDFNSDQITDYLNTLFNKFSPNDFPKKIAVKKLNNISIDKSVIDNTGRIIDKTLNWWLKRTLSANP